MIWLKTHEPFQQIDRKSLPILITRIDTMRSQEKIHIKGPLKNKYDSTTTQKDDRKIATSKPASQRRQDPHRRRRTLKIIRVNSNVSNSK